MRQLYKYTVFERKMVRLAHIAALLGQCQNSPTRRSGLLQSCISGAATREPFGSNRGHVRVQHKESAEIRTRLEERGLTGCWRQRRFVPPERHLPTVK